MNFKKIGLIISVLLILFAFGYEIRDSITEPSFYIPTAFIIGVGGVVVFGVWSLMSSEEKEEA